MSYRKFNTKFKPEQKMIRLDEDDLEIENQIPQDEIPECPTGKRIIPTESRAAAAAQSLRQKEQYSFIHHYKCDECGYWHTGHEMKHYHAKTDLLRFAKGLTRNEKKLVYQK